MGTKLKLILIFSIITHGLFAQNNMVDFLKKYALNRCIQYNYFRVDSTFYHTYNDASDVKFSIRGGFIKNQELKDLINDFTISRTKNFYTRKIRFHLESGENNIVVCSCLDFYESKELDDYVKKILGIKPKKVVKKKKNK